MKRQTYFVVLLFMYLHSCQCMNVLFETNCSYVIDSAGQAFEGYVDSTGKAGDRVPVKKTEDKEFIENGKTVSYLQVVTRMIERPKNGTELITLVADEFVVDIEGYILVNNTNKFERDFIMEFYVVMLAGDEIVSNPVPFVVRVEKLATETSSSFNKPAAVFAGVLVCLIVIFALLIPFVVRAKRRLRSGKPVFKLGSHSESIPNVNKTTDNEKASQIQLITHMEVDHKQYSHPQANIFARTLIEDDFYDNHGFRLEETFEREQNELSKDLLKIAKHVHEHDDGIVIQLKKKDSCDSNSGMSGKNEGIPAIYSVEMDELDKKETTSKHESSQKEETSQL